MSSLHTVDNIFHEIEGAYFKYKKQHLEDSTKKILQVFSRKIQLGQKSLLMTTLRDQSNWLEIERQKNMSTMKTIAFASTAHEFRNPLNAINSSLCLLENKVQETGIHYLQTAQNCSRLMLFLINDILDFSQIESKSIILNYEETDLEEVVKSCIQIMQIKADVKNIKLICNFDEDFPRNYKTDRNRIAQILINLMSNSIKYTLHGFVKVSGKLDNYTNPRYVYLVVEDTGVGMTDEQLKQLFQAFTKIKPNRHLNTEGCGLGLTISRNIAKTMGGDIIAESLVDIGSKFTLKLPFNFEYDNERISLPEILIQDQSQDMNISNIDFETNDVKLLTQPIAFDIKTKECLKYDLRQILEIQINQQNQH